MNAKELQLSKLNAGTKTIGMYLYGIMIGMPIEDIAHILMSDVGYTITGVMDSNVFSESKGCNKLQDVFNYFEIGPKELFKKYNIKEFSEITKLVIESPVKTLNGIMSSKDFPLQYPFKNVYQKLAALAWDPSLRLEEKIATIQRMNYPSNEYKAKARFNQMKLDIIEYLNQVNTLIENESMYKDLKTLAEGAEEARILGSILGLNKGLKSGVDESIKKIQAIEETIHDRYETIKSSIYRDKCIEYYLSRCTGKKPKKDNESVKPFNILDLMNPEKRVKIILEYDKVKHSFNILDVVTTVPHFDGYLLTLITSHVGSINTSPKYEFMYNQGKRVSEMYGLYGLDAQKAYRGIEQYYSDYVKNQWLKNIQFTFPTGSKIFIKGKLIESKAPTTITLGTADGNATFKYYTENTLISQLKDKIGYNKFISDLQPDIVTNGLNKNAIINYTLPINMMPREDNEQAVFDMYQSEFNKLRGFNILLFAGGNFGVPMSISDIFYLYGMIAHYNKRGQNSLMPIFKDIEKIGVAESYHKFESNFDEYIPINKGDKSILPYVIPIKNLYDALSEYVYALDPDTMQITLYNKLSNEELENMSDDQLRDVINGYEEVSKLNKEKINYSNYFIYGDLNKATLSHDYQAEFTTTQGLHKVSMHFTDKMLIAVDGKNLQEIIQEYNENIKDRSYDNIYDAPIPIEANLDTLILTNYNGYILPDMEYYYALVSEIMNEIENGC